MIEVLTFWRDQISPRAKIVEGSARWMKVRARLRDRDVTTKEPRFNVLSLKAAVVGILLSDWHMAPGFPHRRDLDIAFAEGDKVERDLIGGAVAFKRRYGTSALGLIDELAGQRLARLAELCGCGHRWVDHLYRGGPTPDGRQPCHECGCADFDWFDAKVTRTLADAPLDGEVDRLTEAFLERERGRQT